MLAGEICIPAAASKNPANQLQFIPAFGSSTAHKSGKKHQYQSSELLKALHSKLPVPDQASLEQLLGSANRLRIYAGGQSNGKPESKLILFDSKDPEILNSLLKALQIEDHADSFNQYLEPGDPTIELLKNNKRLAVLSFIHPDGLRWQRKWRFDSTLREPRQLIEWLASHKVDGPKQAFEEQVKDKRRSSADLQKWIMSMPECLRPYSNLIIAPAMTELLIYSPEPASTDELQAAEKLNPKNPHLKKLMSVLDSNIENKNVKILGLLQWYASGTGKWTGFPVYEELPAELLLMIPTESIVSTLKTENVSEPELAGAARFFSWHEFRRTKPQDLQLLDQKLKETLLAQCLKSEDPDIRKRAKISFAGRQNLRSADNR